MKFHKQGKRFIGLIAALVLLVCVWASFFIEYYEEVGRSEIREVTDWVYEVFWRQ